MEKEEIFMLIIGLIEFKQLEKFPKFQINWFDKLHKNL